MSALCIVPCGKAKIWNKRPNIKNVKAKYVYTGTFAKTCMEYAERFYPKSWMILSAKYGFLRPNDIVPENYNVTFNDPKTNPITVEKLKEQVIEKGLNKYDTIVIIAGSNYVNMIKQVFVNKQILAPLQSFGKMGYMIQALKQAIKNRKPLQ